MCDSDALWGPLLFLRPARDQVFTRLRLLLVTTLFGAFYGTLADLALVYVSRLAREPLLPPSVLPLALIATAFACGELTFLRAWNERARLSLRRADWIERQGEGPSSTRFSE